jgi:hypothetical protein
MDAEAAAVMNHYYIDNIEEIRRNLPSATASTNLASESFSDVQETSSTSLLPPPPPQAPPRFAFSYANADKVARIIKSAKCTPALGLDGILAVYKQAV